MFNIFTALFGGLYYGGKYLSEKSEIKKINYDIETQSNKMESYKSLYSASYDMEYELQEYIMCGKNFEEICNTLCKELEDVLGKNWKSEIDIPNGHRVNYGCFLPDQHVYWVFHLLLSKEGKMCGSSMYSGHSIAASHTKDRNIKFLQHIENNLRERNIPVVFVYEENGFMSRVKPDVMCIHKYRRLW